MLAVDLMHEIELGVWKQLFTHLIRILYQVPRGSDRVQLLNERYAIHRSGSEYAHSASTLQIP